MILMLKHSQVAQLGKYALNHLDDIKLVRISAVPPRSDIAINESRYIQTFLQVDLNKNFYFSYDYDLTQTLQRNMSGGNEDVLDLNKEEDPIGYKSSTIKKSTRSNTLFLWNEYLFHESGLSLDSPWILPLIHGFVDQSS